MLAGVCRGRAHTLASAQPPLNAALSIVAATRTGPAVRPPAATPSDSLVLAFAMLRSTCVLVALFALSLTLHLPGQADAQDLTALVQRSRRGTSGEGKDELYKTGISIV